MKIHVGVDAGSRYTHTIKGKSANVHDIGETMRLIREDDKVVYGDSGYSGVENVKNSIDYAAVDSKLQAFRDSSLNFLCRALS